MLYLISKIVIVCLMTICGGFIVFVVMKQSGNSDGTEAMTGGSNRDKDSYYGKNAAGRAEQQLKMWTYICSGILAFCAIAFLVLTAIVE